VGMTRREVTLAAVLSHAVTGVVAAVAAFAIAIAVSPLFPLGLGRKIDPAVGVHADWSVIGPGVVLVGGLVLGATALIAWWACRPHIDDRPVRPSRLLTVIRRSAPLTGGLGASIALGGAMGRNRVSVRPALIAAVVAVLSVVGTLTIDQGISDALAHPARAGVAWDATAVPLNQRVAADIDPAWQGKVLGAVPTGTRSAEADRAVIVANGVGAPAFALRALATQSSVRVALVTTSGRAPSRDDEAAIGPKTARDIHAKVGDTIAVGPQNQPVRIVGTALFPSDVHAEFDEGLWITTALFDATAPRGDFAQTREIVLDFPARTNVRAAISRLSGVLGNDAESVSTPETPAELTNLHNVRTLPVLLAVFLALIGIAALGHELITSARRGRHDFAVLRALGLNRSATRLILNAQATVICLVGLAFGLPLGVAVGRVGWRLVTDKVPLAYIAPFPPLGVMLTIAAAMVLANVIALWPGQQVADQLPARALRAD